MKRATVLLIDSHALIHRAFHALPPLTGPKGQPTGALYGVARILLKVLRTNRFTHVFAAFDRPEPTFRKEAFRDYKAHRPPAPDELVSQLIEARELFRAFGIPVVEKAGVEADDIIGTLAVRFAREETRVIILTGDLDALQIVKDPSVAVETFKKGVSETVIYDEAGVVERYGIPPSKLADWKGLVGDASDNIPGVPGIGPKTAEKLLTEFESLEALYEHMPSDHPLAKKVLPHKNKAFLAKQLATIITDVPLPVTLGEGRFEKIPEGTLTDYFSRFGFTSLLKPVPETRSGEVAMPPREEAGNTSFPEHVTFVPSAEWARAHRAALADRQEKAAYGWKEILKKCAHERVQVQGPLFDLSVAGWLIDSDEKAVSREELMARFLKRNDVNDAALYRLLKHALASYGLEKVFREIEMPLVPILAAMEENGIAVDKARLETLRKTIQGELSQLEVAIYEKTGTIFNVNSPRQVAEALFQKLGLGTEKKRKTATGQQKTGKDVLLELREAHPVVPLLLEYRESFKILTSFVEPLADAIAEDGRVRTTFLQTGTATGRLSSERPNLQNIPQGSRWAESLRSAFVAPHRHSFLSFDYSQLELRLLAHASGDPALREVFREGKDVHQLTASRVFGVTADRVIPSMRRTAKILNFGVVYGMGGRAFAAVSGLPPAEAKRFIAEYFRQFPKVREWQERVKAEARTFGFVRNEFGRRRWFLHATRAGHPSGEFERAAINMPLQSLGADIMKLGLIRAASLLGETKGSGRAVLSIHDELLFEMPDDMLHTLAPKLKTLMESAVRLAVPLIVEVTRGPHWGAMEPFET